MRVRVSALIPHHSSYTAHLTTTHLTPLFTPPLLSHTVSHHSSHSPHLTLLISHHSSHRHSSHTTHFTPLITPPLISHHSPHTTYLTRLTSHQLISIYVAERRKTSHVGFSGPFIFDETLFLATVSTSTCDFCDPNFWPVLPLGAYQEYFQNP